MKSHFCSYLIPLDYQALLAFIFTLHLSLLLSWFHPILQQFFQESSSWILQSPSTLQSLFNCQNRLLRISRQQLGQNISCCLVREWQKVWKGCGRVVSCTGFFYGWIGLLRLVRSAFVVGLGRRCWGSFGWSGVRSSNFRLMNWSNKLYYKLYNKIKTYCFQYF